MRAENYIPYLEDLVLSLLAERPEHKEVESLKDPGITYAPGNVKKLIKDERWRRKHQEIAPQHRTKEA